MEVGEGVGIVCDIVCICAFLGTFGGFGGGECVSVIVVKKKMLYHSLLYIIPDEHGDTHDSE